FEAAKAGDDDLLAEAIEDLQPRAVKKAHEFLSTLVSSNATFALEAESQRFQLDEPQDVHIVAARLKEDNIHEEEVTVRGQIQGALPKERSFEATIEATDGEIKGKIASTVDARQLIKEWLNEPLQLTLLK